MSEASINPALPAQEPASLEVFLLGTVDFDAALHLQDRMIDELAGREDRRGMLLVCEHPPLVTIGREGAPDDLKADPRELASRQIPVRWVGRGGGVVVHAPGQLAVYPVVPLQRLGLSPAQLRSRLEEALIGVCDDLKLPAFRRDDAAGVWCRNGRVGSVGLAVKSWISCFGLFVNVAPSLALLQFVQPPAGGRDTSLSIERHSGTLMHTVRAGLVQRVADVLGYERQHVYTGHPLLRRTLRRVPVHA